MKVVWRQRSCDAADDLEELIDAPADLAGARGSKVLPS